MIELYEGEYKYIIHCVQQLLPSHKYEIINSLNVEKNLYATNERNQTIVSFELSLSKEEYLSILDFEKKLRKGRTKKDYDDFDEYCDFFFFIKSNYYYLDENK